MLTLGFVHCEINCEVQSYICSLNHFFTGCLFTLLCHLHLYYPASIKEGSISNPSQITTTILSMSFSNKKCTCSEIITFNREIWPVATRQRDGWLSIPCPLLCVIQKGQVRRTREPESEMTLNQKVVGSRLSDLLKKKVRGSVLR